MSASWGVSYGTLEVFGICQFGRCDTERVCQPMHSPERYVPSPNLNAADVGAMQTREFGKTFL